VVGTKDIDVVGTEDSYHDVLGIQHDHMASEFQRTSMNFQLPFFSHCLLSNASPHIVYIQHSTAT
jgi:hypothetical protein